MKKTVSAGLLAGVAVLVLNVLGLYLTIWLFPSIASQYFNPAFNTQQGRFVFYYAHPFVISLALSWFWTRFKGVLKGSFFSKGLEFGLIYVFVATFPMLWLIYSAMDVTFGIVATWFALALAQGIVAGMVFEKMNP